MRWERCRASHAASLRDLLSAFGFLHPLVPLFNVGYLGVDLFFVLSGFIMTYTHIDRMIDGWGRRRRSELSEAVIHGSVMFDV